MTWRVVFGRRLRRCAAILLAYAAVSCGPNRSLVTSPKHSELSDIPLPPIKRVDQWRFVDLDAPLTGAEKQLKQHFERAFAHAQYSPEYTCVAREDGNFYEKYTARTEEALGEQIAGRCRVPTGSNWSIRIYYSDGTLLDSPLSDALLDDVSSKFAAISAPFTVFGISARYSGPNVLVTLETAAPDATLHISEPDADRNLLVTGEVFGEYRHARVIINQGEFGSAVCDDMTDDDDDDYEDDASDTGDAEHAEGDQDQGVRWPKYAFKCKLAPGDEEAWLSLLATGANGRASPLVELPAHQAGWVPPAEYRRSRLELPRQVDTPTALVGAINEMRGKLGRKPLHLATEQSRFMQPSYDRAFKLNADGNWTGDGEMRAQMLRGDRVTGPVYWGQIASGIAFDGDAADWLAYRMQFPVSRDTLMAADVDEIAIAIHGDPSVGFGAAAVVYTLLTPEREATLAESIAKGIAIGRKGRTTELLENPAELVAVAREVARGHQPVDALPAALLRSNLTTKGSRYLSGLLIPIGSTELDLAPLARLLVPKTLSYGVVMTHVTEPNSGWAIPIAFVWYLTDQGPDRQAFLAAVHEH